MEKHTQNTLAEVLHFLKKPNISYVIHYLFINFSNYHVVNLIKNVYK